MNTHAGSASDNHVTLTFNLLNSGSMHAEFLPLSMCTKFGVYSSRGFSFKSVDKQTVTDATDDPTHSSATASMG